MNLVRPIMRCAVLATSLSLLSCAHATLNCERSPSSVDSPLPDSCNNLLDPTFSPSPRIIAFPDPRKDVAGLPTMRAQAVQAYAAETDPNWKELRVEVDPVFNTVRYVNKIGRVPQDPQARAKVKARMLLLHGTSATISGAEAMRSGLKLLTTQNVGKSGESLKKVQALEHYQPFAAEAIDLPGHRLGPNLAGFQGLDDTARWLGAYLQEMKKETPDLPLIVLARSGSGPIISRTVQLFPGLISALIFMSPPFPGDKDILQEAVRRVHEQAVKGDYHIIPELSSWSLNNKLSISWKDYDFEGVPVLIMTGSTDPEVTLAERNWYKKLAEEFPRNIEYHDIEGAAHDVLRLSTGKNGNTLPQVLSALGFIYRFSERLTDRVSATAKH